MNGNAMLLILSYALKVNPVTLDGSKFQIRSAAVYEDAPSALANTTGAELAARHDCRLAWVY